MAAEQYTLRNGQLSVTRGHSGQMFAIQWRAQALKASKVVAVNVAQETCQRRTEVGMLAEEVNPDVWKFGREAVEG